jgi:hypothetical protein
MEMTSVDISRVETGEVIFMPKHNVMKEYRDVERTRYVETWVDSTAILGIMVETIPMILPRYEPRFFILSPPLE